MPTLSAHGTQVGLLISTWREKTSHRAHRVTHGRIPRVPKHVHMSSDCKKKTTAEHCIAFCVVDRTCIYDFSVHISVPMKNLQLHTVGLTA